MTHEHIFELLKLSLPGYAQNAREWTPNGENCIKVEMTDGRTLVFTCYAPGNWYIETLQHFIDRTEGGHAM